MVYLSVVHFLKLHDDVEALKKKLKKLNLQLYSN